MEEALDVKYIADQLPSRGRWPQRELGEVTDITIHHTAAPVSQTPEQIAAFHLNKHRMLAKSHGVKQSRPRPWPAIAYHYLVYPDGTVLQTLDDSANSWHNGYNNTHALGVCMVGNFEKTEPTEIQLRNMLLLVAALKALYPSVKYLMGHREYKKATLCPGANVDMNALRAAVKLEVNPDAAFPDTLKQAI